MTTDRSIASATTYLRRIADALERMAPASTPITAQPRVYADIQAERDRQDAQWGGPEHDDGHSIEDWCGFITKQLRGACVSSSRERLVKAAALAVAAIESLDREEAPASAPIPDIETDGVRIRGCAIEHDPEAVVQRRVDPGVKVEVEGVPHYAYGRVFWVLLYAGDGRYWRMDSFPLTRRAAEERAAELRTALGLDRPPAPEFDIEARIADAVREEREAVADWFDVEGLHWSAGQIRRGEHRAQERKGGE